MQSDLEKLLKANLILPFIFRGTPAVGVLGIYRSDDIGETWTRINDDGHEWGGPGNGNFVMGDRNVYGRAFMSTAGRGIVYGDKTPETGLVLPGNNASITLYPNPTSNMLYSQGQILKLEIFALNGKKLFETKESYVSVSHLQNGCYLARMHTADGVYNQMFIKN